MQGSLHPNVDLASPGSSSKAFGMQKQNPLASMNVLGPHFGDCRVVEIFPFSVKQIGLSKSEQSETAKKDPPFLFNDKQPFFFD